MSAILPTCVFIPVPVTIARPVPCVTEVPLKIMLARSPSALASVSVSGFLPTGTDSPVSEALGDAQAGRVDQSAISGDRIAFRKGR